MTHALFVYGTLQESSIIQAVTGKVFQANTALLRGYRRNRVKDAQYPAIVPDSKSLVQGQFLFDVDDVSLACLDSFEGEYYQRLPVTVELLSGEAFAASAYVLAPAWTHLLSEEPWDLAYFRTHDLERFRTTYRNF